MRKDDATMRQTEAAQPGRSTWLSANAGSGKTTVLIDRVARLLLGGADPQHILCITYTKAAATEMQNRLFKRLGEWAMLPDAELTRQLEDLDHPAGDDDTRRRARRLFASAIETPGGLRIQTIHSFCAGLLRRFPLEAGVTPQFKEMDDRAAALLRAEILERMADGPNAAAAVAAARHLDDRALDSLTDDVVRRQHEFSRPLDEEALARLLGQPPDLCETTIAERAIPEDGRAILTELVDALGVGGKRDAAAAGKLAPLAEADAIGFADLPTLEGVFLTGSSAANPFAAKIPGNTTQYFPGKAVRDANAPLTERLDEWMARVEEAREPRLALGLMNRTRDLHAFAAAFLPEYDTAKLSRGWLDFDDLIHRTRRLLENRALAEWVLFKIDGGVDHILVDEAQDTSPEQWKVISRLAWEFASGSGAGSDSPRTFFIVGDKKQSIYSFQGADSREFDRVKDEFAEHLENSDPPLQDMTMAHSFRSSPLILSMVDATFENCADSGFSGDEPHIAFKSELPGRIDLWTPVEVEGAQEDPDWHDPVDVRPPGNPQSLLAKSVAEQIRAMIGTPLPDENGGARPARAGDILVLVQRRASLFHDIIRECKAADLPIAGADRLKVAGEIAVRDLEALLSFLSLEDDDLSLATALRSPLFGWPEAELHRLAHGREGALWRALRERRDDFPQTIGILEDLRAKVDFLRPYDLLERILTVHEGRRKLLGRLGPEAEDGIDALLSQALAYERSSVDSLTGFLVWMETDELEIKRQPDSAGDQIRVMTVHGAKGLESPIVIVPDAAKRRAPRLKPIAATQEGIPLWRGSSADAPAALERIDEQERAAQREERNRLLYVALTRAKQWLVIAAAGEVGKEPDESWHGQVRQGLERAESWEGAVRRGLPDGLGERIESGDWTHRGAEAGDSADGAAQSLPEIFREAAPRPEPPAAPISPSGLGGEKVVDDGPGESEEGDAQEDLDGAMLRGSRIHLLLERLPEIPREDWPTAARGLLSGGELKADAQEIAPLLEEAERTLASDSLAHLFAPGTLAEVPLTAPLDALGGRRMNGIVDRLVVEPDRVLAVDFKTNAVIPESADACPDGLLRQMGAYADALSQVYPGREVATAILWTRTAELMHLPADLVREALATAEAP